VKKILFPLPVLFALLFWVIFYLFPKSSPSPTNKPSDIPTSPATEEQSSNPSPSISQSELLKPIADFDARITKKFFGSYITPESSPVSPEKFSGYHTGVDVEYDDVEGDVPVVAITSGEVVTSKFATGYGGVVVIKHLINDKPLFAIYGHLRPDTLPEIDTEVSRGDTIGYLGTGYSSETDGERRHLHFGISLTNSILGYVTRQSDLSNWLDPLSLYN